MYTCINNIKVNSLPPPRPHGRVVGTYFSMREVTN